MIAVDTNVLLRYLLHDDEAQAVRADAVFDAGETVLVTDVVLVETMWTLSGAHVSAGQGRAGGRARTVV